MMSFADGSIFSSVRALVIGDVMLDHYLWSEVSRVSQEAPVPIARIREKSWMLGGAANVAANLRGLGCTGSLLGVCGEDEAGRILSRKLADSGIGDTLLRDRRRPTILKTRIMAQGQQLIRLDEESVLPLDAESQRALLEKFEVLVADRQVVILSDYAKGLLSAAVCQNLIAECRKRGVPVLVDPKGKDWERYRGAACVTPNEAELAMVTEGPIDSEANLLAQAAGICNKLDLNWLLVTRGIRGLVLVGRDGSSLAVPARPREVYDVSGAGDTVIATLAAGVAAGLDWQRAAAIANVAAGIVVGKVGTQPVVMDELRVAMRLDEAGLFHKITALDAAAMQVDAWRTAGERVVFTNGCFDLLHAGHVRLLHAAAQEGSKLVVGLNSDASVKRLKGAHRPILKQEDRASILAALQCVDLVVLFEDDTPLELIRTLRPDVLVKGADYTRETVVGHELVESWGGRVALVALTEGVSTTHIVDTIRGNGSPGGSDPMP